MADKREKKLIEVIEANSSEWIEKFPAVMGDAEGNIDAGGALIYCRLSNGYPITALNFVAPLIYDLQIMVGRSKSQPGYFQVISVRQTYPTTASDFVRFHHEQHEFPAPDTVWVHRKQLMPFTVLVSDAAAFEVRVFGNPFLTASGYALVENQDMDLSSYIPAAGALFVVIETDDDGVLSVNVGDVFGSPMISAIDNIPAPVAGQYPIAAILLYEGQSELSNDDILVFFPMGGNPGNFQPYDEELSEIAALTPAEGDLLRYVGGEWVNVQIEEVVTKRWEPLTNGDPVNPEIIFYDGDVVMVEVEI